MPPTINADAISSAIPDRHFGSLQKLEGGYWWYVGRLTWAKNLVARYHRSKVEAYADIGCGTGGFAKEMRSSLSIAKVALVDAHPEALNKLAQESGVSVLACDITKELPLPFTPTLVSLMDVIEHVEDDEALLARVAQALPSGGCLLLSVPAHQILYSEWDRLLGHHRRYSRSELRAKVARAGLRVREAHYMWSFLFAVGFWRKVRPAKQTSLEFPPVSSLTNKLLILLSRIEWAVQRILPAPFGTSVILIAEKP
jgi:SAM-dependent methyltransferase